MKKIILIMISFFILHSQSYANSDRDIINKKIKQYYKKREFKSLERYLTKKVQEVTAPSLKRMIYSNLSALYDYPHKGKNKSETTKMNRQTYCSYLFLSRPYQSGSTSWDSYCTSSKMLYLLGDDLSKNSGFFNRNPRTAFKVLNMAVDKGSSKAGRALDKLCQKSSWACK